MKFLILSQIHTSISKSLPMREPYWNTSDQSQFVILHVTWDDTKSAQNSILRSDTRKVGTLETQALSFFMDMLLCTVILIVSALLLPQNKDISFLHQFQKTEELLGQLKWKFNSIQNLPDMPRIKYFLILLIHVLCEEQNTGDPSEISVLKVSPIQPSKNTHQNYRLKDFYLFIYITGKIEVPLLPWKQFLL